MPNSKFNQVKFAVDLEFTDIDGRMMWVELASDGRRVELKPTAAGVYRVEIDTVLPGQVVMTVAGKNLMTDTRVDSQHNILADVCVKIRKLWLDRVGQSRNFDRLIVLHRPDGSTVTNSSYIGFNGTITFDLGAPDVFGQMIRWRREIGQGKL